MGFLWFTDDFKITLIGRHSAEAVAIATHLRAMSPSGSLHDDLAEIIDATAFHASVRMNTIRKLAEVGFKQATEECARRSAAGNVTALQRTLHELHLTVSKWYSLTEGKREKVLNDLFGEHRHEVSKEIAKTRAFLDEARTRRSIAP